MSTCKKYQCNLYDPKNLKAHLKHRNIWTKNTMTLKLIDKLLLCHDCVDGNELFRTPENRIKRARTKKINRPKDNTMACVTSHNEAGDVGTPCRLDDRQKQSFDPYILGVH